MFDNQSFCVVYQQIHTWSQEFMYNRNVKEIVNINISKALRWNVTLN